MTERRPRGSTTTIRSPWRPDLCLDFANTRYWRGSDKPTEDLGDFAAVLRWCEAHAGTAPVALRACGRLDPEAAYEKAVNLREAIYRGFLALAESRDPSRTDIDLIGLGPEAPPVRVGVTRTDNGFAWRIVEPSRASVEALLAPVRWSAWDLLVGPRLARLRRCANDQCRWLFVDDSKSGTRRWCSMASCGNRAKAHRHYARKKKA